MQKNTSIFELNSRVKYARPTLNLAMFAIKFSQFSTEAKAKWFMR